MADSSDSDSEEDSKLREALDTSTMTDNLYRKPETSTNSVSTTCNGNGGESATIIANGGQSKDFKLEHRGRPDLKGPRGPSLRRDKQSGEEVVSDIQVTPAFQKFVASKLDELLELEDVEVKENSSDANDQKLAGSHRGVKLTKRSRTDVNPEEAEALSVSRMRTSLLSHREPQVTAEDLAECAVTGDNVISGKEVAHIQGYRRI